MKTKPFIFILNFVCIVLISPLVFAELLTRESAQVSALVSTQVLGKAPAATQTNDNVVVLMVFDGLPNHLVQSIDTPHFDAIAEQGVSRALTSVYPTLSMPNHFSISTGCYPEKHGIVSNTFYFEDGEYYRKNRGDAKYLRGCQLIQETLQAQGIKTALLGAVGQYNDGKPTAGIVKSVDYESEDRLQTQFENIKVELRKGGEERPRFIFAYIDEPDHTLHDYGVDGPEATHIIKTIDKGVGDLVDSFKQEFSGLNINFIVATDHGMLKAGKVVNIEWVLRRLEIDAKVAASASVGHLYLKDPSRVDEYIKKLETVDYIKVIKIKDQPSWSRLGSAYQLGHILISVGPEYILGDSSHFPFYARPTVYVGPEFLPFNPYKGMHGYHPDLKSMKGAFYAWGPGIKKDNFKTNVSVVDINPTISHLLGVNTSGLEDGLSLLQTQ